MKSFAPIAGKKAIAVHNLIVLLILKDLSFAELRESLGKERWDRPRKTLPQIGRILRKQCQRTSDHNDRHLTWILHGHFWMR